MGLNICYCWPILTLSGDMKPTTAKNSNTIKKTFIWSWRLPGIKKITQPSDFWVFFELFGSRKPGFGDLFFQFDSRTTKNLEFFGQVWKSKICSNEKIRAFFTFDLKTCYITNVALVNTFLKTLRNWKSVNKWLRYTNYLYFQEIQSIGEGIELNKKCKIHNAP
jgi:hypothetical protein